MQKVASPADSDPGVVDPNLVKVRIPFVQRATMERAIGPEDLFLIDLGLRGVFVERAMPMEVGEEVTLSFRLPGNEIKVAARCRVAWWRPPDAPVVSKRLPSGVGLEFVEVSSWDRRRIQRHIEEFLARHPRLRSFHRHPAEEDL